MATLHCPGCPKLWACPCTKAKIPRLWGSHQCLALCHKATLPPLPWLIQAATPSMCSILKHGRYMPWASYSGCLLSRAWEQNICYWCYFCYRLPKAVGMSLHAAGMLGLYPCPKHVYTDILCRQINLVLLLLLLLLQKLHQLQLLWNPPLIRMCLDMHAAQAVCTLLI